MNALFSPSLLFLSPEAWNDEARRDQFLAHLLDHLDWIDKLGVSTIYWSDTMEALLWTDPQLPPWRRDRDWQLNIVPVLSTRFSRRQSIVAVDGGPAPFRILPIQAIDGVRGDILSAFLALAHVVSIADIRWCICLGASEAATVRFLEFQCDCHQPVRPRLVRSGSDWLSYIDFLNLFWPSGDQESAERFRLLVECALVKKHLAGQVRVDFRLTDSFLVSISRERRLRQDIVDSLCARIAATQNEAVHNKGLQDEEIDPRSHTRRFRVTRAARIHYRYSGAAEILLIEYYGQGQHDIGLR